MSEGEKFRIKTLDSITTERIKHGFKQKLKNKKIAILQF